MSRGSGRVERRIGELFAATADRTLSVTNLARHAFELGPDAAPDRKQRLSATRAAHRLLRQAAAAAEAAERALRQVIAETSAKLGREPGGRGRGEPTYFATGLHFVPVDQAFAEAMKTAPGWPAWKRAGAAMDREKQRFDGVLLDPWKGGWRATEDKRRRLYFHPGDYPVRVWAVAIRPEGVVWADTEIVGIDNTYVRVRYRGEAARITLLPLPPYSPELNPMDNIWDDLRGNKLSRRVWDSYEAIHAACKDAWLFLVTDPERTDSISYRSWAWVNQ